ncbi:MAG: PepSY domain-containing protein, partial [Stenotrophomonas maltophilia]
MTPWMRTLHRWLGLIVGLQFLLWLGSGLMMSLLDPQKINGTAHRAAEPALPAWPATTLAPAEALRAARNEAATLDTGWLLDQPVYRLLSPQGTELIDAYSGKRIEIDPRWALRLAQASYRGSGVPADPVHLEKTLETRAHPDPVWRVDFGDEAGTSVYVSAQSGQVLEHRNDTWRLFDIFWMLHIMDYTERANFNNPLVVGMGIGGLWLSLTGLWLLVAS